MRRFLARFGFLACLVAVGALIVAHPAWAAEPSTSERVALFFADVATMMSMVLASIVVALLDIIIIPIMQYNGFVDSPVVAAGWAIIRDTVNMFFVVVLVVIAFGTIFGSQRFTWQQQIPRLMIFAIVINFSRTLCGIMIDFGQVIMLTFANAIKDIAGGNFIQLFGMNDIFALSTSGNVFDSAINGNANATGAVAFDFLLGSVVSFGMMIMVLTMVVMLTAVLVWRIVMLWILVTVSPLAWFVGGAQEVLKSDAYKDWWDQFKCYVMVGPILTFFLWLTLAVAGAGNIAATAGFNTAYADTSITNPAGSILKIMESSRLLSFIIGMALLTAGFNAAQKACNHAQGGIGDLLGKTRKAVFGSPLAAAALGYKGTGLGLRGGRYVKNRLGANIAQYIPVQDKGLKRLMNFTTTAGRAYEYRDLSKNPLLGSKTLSSIAGGWADQMEKARSEEVKAAGAGWKDSTRESKVSYIKALAASGRSWTAGGKDEDMAVLLELLGDPQARKEMEKNGSLQFAYEALKKHPDLAAAAKGDKHLFHNLEEFEEARPDISKHFDHVKDMEDVRKLDKQALVDPKVRERLKAISSGTTDDNGVDISAYDFIARGRLGTEKQGMLDVANTLGPVKSKKEIKAMTDPKQKEAEEKKRAFSAYTPGGNKVLEISDQRALTDIVSKNAGELGYMQMADLNANEGNNDLARASIAGLNNTGLQKLFRQYAEGTDEDRVRLQNAMENTQLLLMQAKETALDPKPYEKMETYFNKQRGIVEARFGVPAASAQANRQAGANRQTVETQRQARGAAVAAGMEQAKVAADAERQAQATAAAKAQADALAAEQARAQRDQRAAQNPQIRSLQEQLRRETDPIAREDLIRRINDLYNR